MLGRLRNHLPGFDALAQLAKKTCPDLRLEYAHVLQQTDAQACADWHTDTQTAGYERVQKTLVAQLSRTQSEMQIRVGDRAVETFQYDGMGSIALFNSAAEHRSGKATFGTIKVAFFLGAKSADGAFDNADDEAEPPAIDDADCEAEADEPASAVGPTRKRGTEDGAGSEPSLKRAKMAAAREASHAAARAATKAAAEAEAEAADGGYSLLPRGQHYAQGGVMTIGDARTCLTST